MAILLDENCICVLNTYNSFSTKFKNRKDSRSFICFLFAAPFLDLPPCHRNSLEPRSPSTALWRAAGLSRRIRCILTLRRNDPPSYRVWPIATTSQTTSSATPLVPAASSTELRKWPIPRATSSSTLREPETCGRPCSSVMSTTLSNFTVL